MLSCNKEDDETEAPIIDAQNVSLLVAPIQTDVNFLSTEKEHYVVRNNQIHLNKLLLFIGGSFSTPENYNIVCDYSATIGLDVISLSYPNNIPAATLGSSSDQFVFDNYRDEICFGNLCEDGEVGKNYRLIFFSDRILLSLSTLRLSISDFT